jgi:hypothetical protein
VPRGEPKAVGDKYIASNGYEYTKTDGGWRLTHHILAEANLGRPLREGERVRFKDGDRSNLVGDNIIVRQGMSRTKEARRARIEAKLEELKAELEGLEDGE